MLAFPAVAALNFIAQTMELKDFFVLFFDVMGNALSLRLIRLFKDSVGSLVFEDLSPLNLIWFPTNNKMG